MTKRCTKCRIEKEESCYHKDKYSPDALTYWCKVCVAEQGKRYKNAHPLTEEQKEKNKVYQREWIRAKRAKDAEQR